MCGRYTRHATWAEVHAFTQPLAIRYPDDDPPPQYNIAPSQQAWVIADTGAGLVAQTMRWGYLPRWAKDPKMPRPINARADTVASSGMFRGSFGDRRCVVVANGWYEWRVESPPGDGGEPGKPVKQPFYFAPADGRVLGFAGIWDQVRGAEGPERSFAIVTCGAGPVACVIHDRMPVTLRADDLDLWLDPRAEKRDVAQLLVAEEPEGLAIARVGRAVNSPKNDTPSLVVPETTDAS